MYNIETVIAPKQSWFTPAEAKSYYGAYSREGLTVHWWGGGEPASAHDSIVNYFLQQGAQGIKSVNYVVSDIKITKMVEPDNVAWASQSGNSTTISIEFQPTLSGEGYKRGGWLIAQLEKQYGHKLTLYPHSHWFNTSCPGTIDINRLRAEAIKEGDNVSDNVTIVGAPSAVSWGDGRIDVFARGTDNGLWHLWYDGQWHNWERVGGGIASSPGVSSWREGRLDAFATGISGDLMHFYYDGGSFSTPESLGIPKIAK